MQERSREGSRPLRPSALHALAENPQLWHMLVANRLFGRGGGGGDAAGDEEEDQTGGDGTEASRAEVSCRMN